MENKTFVNIGGICINLDNIICVEPPESAGNFHYVHFKFGGGFSIETEAAKKLIAELMAQSVQQEKELHAKK